MYKRRKNKISKLKKTLIITALIIILIIVSVVIFVEKNINPIIVSVSNSRIKALSEQAVAQSIHEVVSSNVSYLDLVDTKYDDNGKITLIQINSSKANYIAQVIAIDTNNKIAEFGDQGLDISIGTLTGMPAFTERGPFANFQFLPIGSAKCTIVSSFSSAGINQTIHRLYAVLKADVTVIIPGLRDKSVQIETKAVLAESIIVGDVPSIYINTGNANGTLNLVP